MPTLFLAIHFSSLRIPTLFLTTEYLHGSPEHILTGQFPPEGSLPSRLHKCYLNRFSFIHIKKTNTAQPSKQNLKGPSFSTSQPLLLCFSCSPAADWHIQCVIWDVGRVEDGTAWVALFPFPQILTAAKDIRLDCPALLGICTPHNSCLSVSYRRRNQPRTVTAWQHTNRTQPPEIP